MVATVKHAAEEAGRDPVSVRVADFPGSIDQIATSKQLDHIATLILMSG